jgi:K+-sensing histidine kinase KdpD
MPTLINKRKLIEAFFPYPVALGAICLATVIALRFGSQIFNPAAIFFCAVMLSSWYGGFLPGIFAALLASLALDYYFIPPIHSFAVYPAEAFQMVAFGITCIFISWLNNGQKWFRGSLRQEPDNQSALWGIVSKLIIAFLASLASCVAALISGLFQPAGTWQDFWITFGLASCGSATYLIVLVCPRSASN